MSNRVYRGDWLVTVSLAAAAAAYFCLVFLPAHKAIAQLEGEVRQKQDYIAGASAVAADLLAAEKELATTRAYNAAWKHRGPNEREFHLLYAKISEVAKTAGAVTTSFQPKPAEEYERLRGIPLAMGCNGTFNQICELLRKVESLPMVIWVESLDLKPRSESGESVSCEVNLVVFANNSNNSD